MLRQMVLICCLSSLSIISLGNSQDVDIDFVEGLADGSTQGVCNLSIDQVGGIDAIAWDGSGAEIISREEFPRAVAFLEKIVAKYPEAFKNVKIVMSRMPHPQASPNIIHIPYNWLLELEAEISKVQGWTEWALLHEAGHIKNSHVVKCFTAQWLINLVGLSGIAYLMYKIQKADNRKDFDTAFKSMFVVYFGYFITAFVFPVAYSRFVMEPEADDFAARTCDNPEALEAGAVFLDKCSLNNIMYPTVQSRIDKIHQALRERFSHK